MKTKKLLLALMALWMISCTKSDKDSNEDGNCYWSDTSCGYADADSDMYSDYHDFDTSLRGDTEGESIDTGPDNYDTEYKDIYGEGTDSYGEDVPVLDNCLYALGAWVSGAAYPGTTCTFNNGCGSVEKSVWCINGQLAVSCSLSNGCAGTIEDTDSGDEIDTDGVMDSEYQEDTDTICDCCN
ncbi:MAG: hypothetical protein JXR91_11890 [Deltaproteobacteria bacterium]|nr:hypothetical protein [Deltaproteobacteria bacterium]